MDIAGPFDFAQGRLARVPVPTREQAKRRPALVLTDQSYNRASGLAVVCPLTSQRKAYPFALPVMVDKVEGAVQTEVVAPNLNQNPYPFGKLRAGSKS